MGCKPDCSCSASAGSCSCSPTGSTREAGDADPGWLEVHAELRGLHAQKSATYGNQVDRFRNFTAVAEATGSPEELYALCRIREKVERAINMVQAGLQDEVAEYRDIASLGLICEALRRRRSA